MIVLPFDVELEMVEVTYTKRWFWSGNDWQVSYTIDVTDGEGNVKTASTDSGNTLSTGKHQALALN